MPPNVAGKGFGEFRWYAKIEKANKMRQFVVTTMNSSFKDMRGCLGPLTTTIIVTTCGDR